MTLHEPALAASAFNWTPRVIEARAAADDIALAIVTDGISPIIEVEAGQVWRGFPNPEYAEVDALRTRLAEAGGRVAVVGGAIDEWASPGRRRDDGERLAFLTPQLRAAQRIGARGLRVPFGQPGTHLIRALQPVLHELDLVLYLEIQGRQHPGDPITDEALQALVDLADPHVRLLVDLSLCMPALPVTYLEAIRAGGLDLSLLSRLDEEWNEPGTLVAIVDHLRSGAVPPHLHTLFMDLLVRFGNTPVGELGPLLDITGGFHLKFWDLEDIDGRVSAPLRALGGLLHRHGSWAHDNGGGVLTSEWGGHEWLDDDPSAMTRAHLDLARTALSATQPS